MPRTLDVYMHRRLAGRLTQDEVAGEMMFDYEESWLNAPDAFPISISLPLRRERFTRRECRGFFAGILPENAKREVIARHFGISARNDFAMLDAIGGECAGAVTFVPPDTILPEAGDRYRELTNDGLARILQELPRRPLLAGEDGIRLSLAGAQDKIAVRVDGEKISLPLGDSPSTHIIKPAIEQYIGLVHNEAFCMGLARAAGLTAPRVEMRNVQGIDYLLIERYDRVRTGETIARLHQEDFCQALGIAPEYKYQSEGGPSIARCFSLVRDHSVVAAKDVPALLDRVIYNFLIGNNDAHGKNYAFLYENHNRAQRVSLAPCYDLVSTAIYPELTQKMAMKIGGEYTADRVYLRHFLQMAEEIGTAKTGVRQRVRRIAKSVMEALPVIEINHPIARQISALVTSRCQRLLDETAEPSRR